MKRMLERESQKRQKSKRLEFIRGNLSKQLGVEKMSTYYYFVCNKCSKYGGFISRQAWGYGNFDIIDSFKFIVKHKQECGTENIGLAVEHDIFENYEEDKDLPSDKDVFPHSNDWCSLEKRREEGIMTVLGLTLSKESALKFAQEIFDRFKKDGVKNETN